MYTIHRTKLYKGNQVDVRSYERQDAILRNQDLLIVLDGVGEMLLTVDQLKDEKLILSKQRVPSRVYIGQYYDLISYKWKERKLTAKEKKQKKNQEAFAKYNSLSPEEQERWRLSH